MIPPAAMQADLLGAAPSPDGVQRLFFALVPPLPLQERLAAAAAEVERSHPSGGRPGKPDRYHLTLHFLGDFDPLPPSLREAARAAGDAVAPRRFELVFDHAANFAGNGVRWLGGPPSDALQALWGELGEALARRGIRAVRQAFVPHLTIAMGARPLPGPVAIDPVSWPVDGFALVLARPGRPYEILQRWSAA